MESYSEYRFYDSISGHKNVFHVDNYYNTIYDRLDGYIMNELLEGTELGYTT